MGILTNLLQLAWQEEDRTRNSEIQRYAAIAGNESNAPEIRAWATNELGEMGPPKSKGIKDIGSLFSGLVGRGAAKQQQMASMQRYHEALASTGRPEMQSQITGQPAPMDTTSVGGTPLLTGGQRQPNMPVTIPGVRPSALLSPQDQMAMQMDELRRKLDLTSQIEQTKQEGLDKIKLDFERRSFEQQNKQRDDYYKQLTQIDPKTGKPIWEPDRAFEMAYGIKPPAGGIGTLRAVPGTDTDVQAWLKEHNRWQPGDENKSFYVDHDKTTGKITDVIEGPAVKKPDETPTGAPRDLTWARKVIDDAAAAKRTGRAPKFPAEELEAANDFIANYKKPTAAQITMQAQLPAKDVEFYADQYNLTHELPPGGYGAAGQIRNTQILRRAAEKAMAAGDTAGSLRAKQAMRQSAIKSMGSLRRQYDAVATFEKTATVNLDRAIKRAQSAIDAGSIPANYLFRGAARVWGSGPQAVADTARVVAYTEISRVLSSATSNAQLSEGARTEGQRLLNGNYPIQTLIDVGNLLKQDMGTRKQSYLDQMKEQQDIISGTPEPEAGGTPPPGGPPSPPLGAGGQGIDWSKGTSEQFNKVFGPKPQ